MRHQVVNVMKRLWAGNLANPYFLPGVDVIKLFWRKSGKSRFPLKPKQQQ